jgi:hypothetical protein
MLFSVRFPCDGTTGVEDNGAAHPAEFEEWELNAFSDSIANS